MNNMNKMLSVFAVALMVMSSFALLVPSMVSDDSDAASEYYSYTINISGGTTSTVSITSVKDASGNTMSNLTSSSVGSWGWDADGYGPFNSFYAAFDPSTGRMICHLNPSDLEKDVDGNSVTISNYNVMWCLPTVYWKSDSSGNLTLSNDPSSGGTAYAHTIDGKVYKFVAYGVYESSVTNTQAFSKSDVNPTASTPRTTFRTYSEKVLTDSEIGGGYSMQWNWYQYQLYRFTVLATLGTFNSQSFGQGIVNGNLTTTGGTNQSTSSTPGYYASSSTSAPVRLFIENGWGNVWDFVDNVVVSSGTYYAGQTHNATDTTSNLTSLGAATTGSGYGGSVLISNGLWGIPNFSTSGSDSSGTYDYYYGSGNSNRSVFVGGSWVDGSSAGVSYVFAYNSLSGSYTGVGSRLAYVFDADPAASKQVSFNPGAGSGTMAAVEVDIDATYTLPECKFTAPRGYEFAGWAINAAGTGTIYKAGSTMVISDNITLYATWTQVMCTVTFYYNVPVPPNNNNVYSVMTTAQYTVLAEYPSDPELTDLKFAGWFTDADCKNSYNISSTVNSDMSVYAKWDETLEITSTPSASANVTLIGNYAGGYKWGFDASGSENWTSIEWNFGDGTTSNDLVTTHTYADPGEYTVSLIVFNSLGETDVMSKKISVGIADDSHEFNVVGLVLLVVLIAAAIAVFYFYRNIPFALVIGVLALIDLLYTVGVI